MLKIALIGCGGHSGPEHAQPLSRIAREQPGRIELVAACDRQGERAEGFCARYGFKRAFDDVEAMLGAVEPDACAAIVPIPAIVEVSSRLLEAGIPCIIEKPPGASLAQARQLAAVARRTGTVHQVSVNRRFVPWLNEAAGYCREAGPVHFVRATQARHRRGEPEFIWGTGIHAIDAMRHLAGEVREVRPTRWCEGAMQSAWYELSLAFEGGARGCLHVMPTTGVHVERYELFAGERAAAVDLIGARQSLLRCWEGGKLVVDRQAGEDEPPEVRSGAYDEHVAFVEAVERGRAGRPTVDEVIDSMRIGLEALEAQEHWL